MEPENKNCLPCRPASGRTLRCRGWCGGPAAAPPPPCCWCPAIPTIIRWWRSHSLPNRSDLWRPAPEMAILSLTVLRLRPRVTKWYLYLFILILQVFNTLLKQKQTTGNFVPPLLVIYFKVIKKFKQKF